jgi:hypothetical protein
MATDFTIRVVTTDPDGKTVVRVLTPADISASIMHAGYAPGVGLMQLRLVIERTIRFLDMPKEVVPLRLTHTPEPPSVA